MKDFFSRYSYDSVKLFLDQLVVGMFGFSLALVAGKAESAALKYASSVFAILFMLFLQYTVMWRMAAKDSVSISIGKRKADYTLPLKMWLLSNIPSFILALAITADSFVTIVVAGESSFTEAFHNVSFVSKVLSMIVHGSYMGVMSLPISESANLNSLWFMYFVITLPSLGIEYLAYGLGIKGIHFTNMLTDDYPNSDKPEKGKKK